MYPGIFPGACRKGEVIYDRLHYCRNHYDGCGFCFCDNGNDEGSFYIRRSYREVYGECEGEEWWFTEKRKRTVTLNVRNVKKIFCTEEYDMASYKYRDKLGGRYIYFCSYNCMMRYKREKGQYKDKITEEKYEVEDVKLQNKRENVLRVYSPGGVQF